MERSVDMESFSDDSVVNMFVGLILFDDLYEGDIGFGVRFYQFELEVDIDEEIFLLNLFDCYVEWFGNNDW